MVFLVHLAVAKAMILNASFMGFMGLIPHCVMSQAIEHIQSALLDVYDEEDSSWRIVIWSFFLTWEVLSSPPQQFDSVMQQQDTFGLFVEEPLVSSAYALPL